MMASWDRILDDQPRFRDELAMSRSLRVCTVLGPTPRLEPSRQQPGFSEEQHHCVSFGSP